MSNDKNTFTVPEANGFHELEQDEVKKIKEEAWSVESMPGHDAANLATKYIGSSFEDPVSSKDGEAVKVFDYFVDSSGGHWYGVRVLLPTGKLISMEEFLFGRKAKDKKYVGNNLRNAMRSMTHD